ncbi:MAG TPA: Cof-type HAD-IIB family hydrolase [Feifaniaceae bacterium]|nr:Cof-type HAD-IIB family hydrolase [Feifaniaceae bacterium]
MKNNTYRVLALDLDGTLTNEKKEVTPRTKEAVRRAIHAGVAVVLATGRPLIGVLPVARELALDTLGGYILCYNGALIQECRANTPVFRRILPANAVKDICAWARGKPVCPLAYDACGVITPYPDNRYVLKEAYNNNLGIRAVEDLPGFIDYPIEKMMLVGEPSDARAALPELKARFGGELNIFGSEPPFIEVMPPEVDKAFALDVLLNHIGVTREALIACGDGMNDIPMLRIAGMAVAMGNAAAAVKALAGFVTRSNEEDGVAHAIERFIDI